MLFDEFYPIFGHIIMKNYYHILGVKLDCDKSDIKRLNLYIEVLFINLARNL